MSGAESDASSFDSRSWLAALAQLRKSDDEVTFVGGEPTLAPALTELVAAARKLGFRGVGVQTNGRLLADPSVFRPLAAAGLTDVHLSIHGSEPAVHDYHVGVAGAFAEIVAALGQARSLGVKAVATTVLTRSNYRVLAGLPGFLKGAGVSGWLIALPRIVGALAAGDDRTTPRLALALPFALQALSIAQRAGLSAWIRGAPACLLGPYAARLLPEEPPRAYADVCQSCPSRARCPGVDARYLKSFGSGEISAKDTPAARRPAPIARLFVGVGELPLVVRPPG